jgi:two-component system sensor histidine kinase TctE
MRSIRLALLKWLLLPLLGINLIGAAGTYWLAWRPAQLAFDQNLADAAWTLLPYLQQRDGGIVFELSRQAEQVLRLDHFDSIYFVVRNADGDTLAGDQDFPPLQAPPAINEPLAYDSRMRGEAIRAITLSTLVGSEPVTIGVAETLWKRISVRSGASFAGLLLLELLLTFISIAIVWFGVSRGLSPLKAMQSSLNARSYEDLAALPAEHMALELEPVAAAINGLLDRVRHVSRGQQAFLANAAHQLRTPLAGLKTQLEWLQQRHAGDQDVARSTGLMMASTERMIRQTNQLLALARAEPSQFEKARLYPLALDKLVEESVQHFVEEADKKNIDLGFELAPVTIPGDRFLLRDLIDNLVDNAIRYAPQHGRVTVSCYAADGAGVLAVEDNGPGIPASERELVFSRFYRLSDKTTGSGLGLAIVRDIAADHRAQIRLDGGAGGHGTVFSVRFPLATAAQEALQPRANLR